MISVSATWPRSVSHDPQTIAPREGAPQTTQSASRTAA
jgi:hypothetical protein